MSFLQKHLLFLHLAQFFEEAGHLWLESGYAQLFGVERECPEYIEAKRLLKFLDYFVGIGSEKVPTNSLLREFIGGGCFRV